MTEAEVERLERYLHPAGNSRYPWRQTKICPVCGKRFRAGADWGYGVGAKDTCTWTCQRKLEREGRTMPRKISEEDIERIQAMRLEGKTLLEIEAETGISHTTISRHVKGIGAPKAEKPKASKPIASEQETMPETPAAAETVAETVREIIAEASATGRADSAKIAKLAIESIEALARFATGGSGTAGIAHLIQLQTEIIREVLE